MRHVLILFVLIIAGMESRAGRSSISGHVTSSTGKALDSAVVRLTADGGWQFAVRSDASGYFSITGLDSRSYTATISRRGFESQRFVDIQLNVGKVLHLSLDASMHEVHPGASELRTSVYGTRAAKGIAPGRWMAATGSGTSNHTGSGKAAITGTLKDETGTPVVNADVEVSKNGVVCGRGLTDFDGDYGIAGLKRGVYAVKFKFQGRDTAVNGIALATKESRTVNGVIVPLRLAGTVVPTRSRNIETAVDLPATKGGPQESILPATHIPALLSAAELNDFSKWFLWDEMSNPELDAYRKTWKIRPENRISVLVKASNGLALPNADVSLLSNGAPIWEARTDNTGKAELWYDMFRNDSTLDAIMSLHVRAGGAQDVMYSPVTFDQGINTFRSSISCRNPQKIDVAFIVDATGSMGEEIGYLKAGLRDIFSRVADSMPLTHVQTAAVFYRDRGEEFLVRSSMLTDNLVFTENFISSNNAAGGGDGPEALESALGEGLGIGWRPDASARLAFLMTDAPPHGDSLSLLRLEAQVRAYAARGIRLIPIASNRADKSTAYLLRSMALATNGTYLFLSDQHAGDADSLVSVPIIDTAGLNQLVYRVIRNFSTMPECATLELALKDTVAGSAQLDGKRTTWKLSSNQAATDLQVDHDEKSGYLFVSDVNGKLVQRIKVDPSGHSIVDMKQFPAGMYSIRHSWGWDKEVAGTFVLQH